MLLPPRRIRRFGRQTRNAVNIQRCRVNQVSLTTDDVSRIDNDLSREFSDSIKELTEKQCSNCGRADIKSAHDDNLCKQCSKKPDKYTEQNRMKSSVNKNDCEILEKELKKITVIQTEKPKRKLPTMLIKYVPKDVTDAELKNTLLHQNNLSHLEEREMNIKFTKKTFDDSRSRQLVIEFIMATAQVIQTKKPMAYDTKTMHTDG
ncbi:hypothetical protein C0J52_16967 [Blattella germanica]|nr:hypothetical protein C0J52_16967 [Blattella germanica]